eukprot:154560-Hanusia_phi.AAC.1
MPRKSGFSDIKDSSPQPHTTNLVFSPLSHLPCLHAPAMACRQLKPTIILKQRPPQKDSLNGVETSSSSYPGVLVVYYQLRG